MTDILKLQKESDEIEELILALEKVGDFLRDRYADINYALSEYAAVKAEMEDQDGTNKDF